MKWLKYTIDTTTSATDFICGMLDELGIEGIEIEDNVPLSEEDKLKMFIDIVPELGYDDGTAKIHFYLEDGMGLDQIGQYLSDIRKGLEDIKEYVDIGSGEICPSVINDDDWLDNWKKNFKPFKIDDHIVIKPTWEPYDGDDKDIIIEIDPGRAFGTGSHETTQLCIMAMNKYIRPNDVVLDIGMGSGILSIAAMKLGAGRVVGTDIDEIAIDVSRENIMINNYGNDIKAYRLDIVNHEEDRKVIWKDYDAKNGRMIQGGYDTKNGGMIQDGYDMIIANILADVIVHLSGIVGTFMKNGTYFVSSGIIDTKADEVEDALIGNGFKIVDKLTMNEWVCYVAGL